MAIYIPWLADAARLTGYPVSEAAGWRSLGHGGFRVVEGVVAHHTADGPSGDYPSFNVVRNGRAGLAGPLSNYGLGRTGRIQVIAAGCCWHAGASRWAGFTDINDEFIGIEAESVGSRDDWTAAQRDCYPRLVAAALYYMRRGADRLCGHKECALPLGRKVDPAFWNLNDMRNRVAWLLADPLRRIPVNGGVVAPPPAPNPNTGDGDMDAAQDKMLREIHRELTLPLPLTGRPGPLTDNHYGHVLSMRAETRNVGAALFEANKKLDQILTLVKAAGVDPAAVKSAIETALGGGFKITGEATPKA